MLMLKWPVFVGKTPKNYWKKFFEKSCCKQERETLASASLARDQFAG
jgi:hypothetical protein